METQNTKEAQLVPNDGKYDALQTMMALKGQLDEVQKEANDGISLEIDFNGKTISEIKKAGELIEIGAFIESVSGGYNKFREEQGLSEIVVEWKHSNKTAEEWKKIITKAIKQIIDKEKEKQLKSAIDKLEDCLDPETRTQMKIKSIVEKSQRKVE